MENFASEFPDRDPLGSRFAMAAELNAARKSSFSRKGSASHAESDLLGDPVENPNVEIRLPGLDGLDCNVQRYRHGSEVPVVLVMAHADVQLTVRAAKAGAIDFLVSRFPYSRGGSL